jgi:hypothetical protein
VQDPRKRPPERLLTRGLSWRIWQTFSLTGAKYVAWIKPGESPTLVRSA